MLILGIIIPLVIFAWSFNLSNVLDISSQISYHDYTPTTERENVQFFVLLVLFLVVVISTIWQTSSWFLHCKFIENNNSRTQKVRKIIGYYYIFLVISIL